MRDPGGRIQDLAYEAEGYRRAGDVGDRNDESMPSCKTRRCGHPYTDHDDYGRCRATILTVLDTPGHCGCSGYDQWGT